MRSVGDVVRVIGDVVSANNALVTYIPMYIQDSVVTLYSVVMGSLLFPFPF